ncbi:TetR/AcrR family transcriptional regulator [Dermabacteraceae bacterium P13128]
MDTNARAKRRQLFVDIATELFGEFGFHGTAMSDIAYRAGITKPVLYQFFDSKDDLYLAVVDSIANQIIPTLRDLASATGESPERVRACVEVVFETATQPGNIFRLFFSPDADALNPEISDRVHEVIDRCNSEVTNALARNRSLSTEDAAVVALAVSTVAQACAAQLPTGSSKEEKERYIALVCRFLNGGLSAFPDKKD